MSQISRRRNGSDLSIYKGWVQATFLEATALITMPEGCFDVVRENKQTARQKALKEPEQSVSSATRWQALNSITELMNHQAGSVQQVIAVLNLHQHGLIGMLMHQFRQDIGIQQNVQLKETSRPGERSRQLFTS